MLQQGFADLTIVATVECRLTIKAYQIIYQFIDDICNGT